MADKLGIVAGAGDLPARLIEVCRQSGREIFVLAFEGETDPATVAGVDHGWVNFHSLTQGLQQLRDSGVGELVLLGSVKRPSLKDLNPDIKTAKFIAKAGIKALGDDGLLRAIVAALEEERFRVSGVDDFLSHLLAEARIYTSAAPDANAEHDIQLGLNVVRALGALDVGQAAVVHQGVVLGVEAQEGTDALLERCAGLRQLDRGGVLVKVKKPHQERRVDLPTIGPRTVEGAAVAGLSGIAVEAGSVLIVDAEQVRDIADAAGLFVIGVPVPS
jgi:DUF1009 family protein